MLSVSALSVAKNEVNDGVRVVCMIVCEGCGHNFKPNSYYRHVVNCCGNKMNNSLKINWSLNNMYIFTISKRNYLK